MNKANLVTTMALAGAFASALATAVPASAAGMEECYGIALKGQNDCKAGSHDCKGMSKVDYDSKSFKFVPVGTCTKMKVHGHKGMLKSM
jgi:uncharacterized membrane protein